MRQLVFGYSVVHIRDVVTGSHGELAPYRMPTVAFEAKLGVQPYSQKMRPSLCSVQHTLLIPNPDANPLTFLPS